MKTGALTLIDCKEIKETEETQDTAMRPPGARMYILKRSCIQCGLKFRPYSRLDRYCERCKP